MDHANSKIRHPSQMDISIFIPQYVVILLWHGEGSGFLSILPPPFKNISTNSYLEILCWRQLNHDGTLTSAFQICSSVVWKRSVWKTEQRLPLENPANTLVNPNEFYCKVRGAEKCLQHTGNCNKILLWCLSKNKNIGALGEKNHKASTIIMLIGALGEHHRHKASSSNK